MKRVFGRTTGSVTLERGIRIGSTQINVFQIAVRIVTHKRNVCVFLRFAYEFLFEKRHENVFRYSAPNV